MTECLQYYYETEEDSNKYKIDCGEKIFENLNEPEKFNNKDLLEFIKDNYSSTAFPEDSPFEFKEDYSKLSNDQICKAEEMNLAPQQKFLGQILGPNTNFYGMLIYHGLGSGKSCTSIVIGEALKNSTNQRIIYTVPAPLVDQYYEEIKGEIRNGKFFSCPSFCLIKNGGKLERDIYVSDKQNIILGQKIKIYEAEKLKLKDIISKDDDPESIRNYNIQENYVKKLNQELKSFENKIKSKIIKTFEIISHNSFIESLYKTGKQGQLIRNKRLLEDSGLLRENGLLVIDEIQRLVSAGGTFYKKLYNAIKYFFHPKLKIAVMSATPLYDNPYELALTINLLRPRVPFPINKQEFYRMFIGRMNEDGTCEEFKNKNNSIKENSCLLNQELLSHLCSGYISYFKGGNPNAYPYKRIITMEHVLSSTHKTEYIEALKSDILKSSNTNINEMPDYDNVLLGNYDTEEDDKITGMFVITQQYSNIILPKIGEKINKTLSDKKQALNNFRRNLLSQNFNNSKDVLEYIKPFSTKFSKIIELTLLSDGPVFIFSNWLAYGVEPLSIILEACGLSSFEKNNDKPKFFVWSSETKTKDKDNILINNARNTFNSVKNSDGSLLKVILGTRSVMEGVSFKNVKQVHITDPWWNESRIEQILARASRYCSHSNLSVEDQYVDIYRHYSVLPVKCPDRDDDVNRMLIDIKKSNVERFAIFSCLSIDQKLLQTSIKKDYINTDINKLLKSCSVDSELNKNGNLVRLEETVIPLSNGFYQIVYRNPSNGRMYLREGIPSSVTFDEIYSRKYSYPNKNYPIKFIESNPINTEMFEPYPDAEIIEPPDINEDLILKEEIIPWKSEKKLSDIELSYENRKYIYNIYKNYNLLPELRKIYFNERGDKSIKTSDKNSLINRKQLIECIKQMAEQNLVSKNIKKDIAKEFSRDKIKDKVNKKVIEIVYTYKAFPESFIEELLEIGINNPESLDDMLKMLSKQSKEARERVKSSRDD